MDIAGTTGTPGKYLADKASIGPTTLGSIGGILAMGLSFTRSSMLTAGSPIADTSAAIVCSDVFPGNMRQLTLAVARWGSAFSAWPAETIVGTQGVRSRECSILSRLTTASAAVSAGLAASATIARPVSSPRIAPERVK